MILLLTVSCLAEEKEAKGIVQLAPSGAVKCNVVTPRASSNQPSIPWLCVVGLICKEFQGGAERFPGECDHYTEHTERKMAIAMDVMHTLTCRG